MTPPTQPGTPDDAARAGAGVPDPMALLRSLDALSLRAIELTRNAVAELTAERLDELLEQLHLRDLLLNEVGDVLAHLTAIREDRGPPSGASWTDAAEAEWQQLAGRLHQLSVIEAELAEKLLAARESIAEELSRLRPTPDPISPYRSGYGSKRIDRRG